MKRVSITKAFLIILIVLSIIAGGALAFIVINPNVLGLISSDGRITISMDDYNDLIELYDRYGKAEFVRREIKNTFYTDVEDQDLETALIKGLVEGTDDIYSGYYTEDEYNDLMVSLSGEYDGVGMTMTQNENGYIEVIAVTKDSPAEQAGVSVGEFITEVNGETFNAADMDLCAATIRGKKGTTVKVKFLKDGKEIEREFTRAHITSDTVEYEILDDNIACITITSFENATEKDFKAALTAVKDAKALIIDLRDNPGGLVDSAIKIADELMDNATVVYTQDHNGNKDYYKTGDGKAWYKPFVVLINENSASASEIFAAGIQDNKVAPIVGNISYGKGIIQSIDQLSDGSALKLTKWQYFTPSGKQINKVGVTPDYIVKDVEGKDAQLEKAIELLNQ